MRVRYRAIAPRPEALAPTQSRSGTGRSVIEWLEVLVAPATVVTGWFFWFGYCYANARAVYFGLDATTLGFSTNDYIIRSLTPQIVPAVVVIFLVIFLLTAHIIITHAIGNKRFHSALKKFAFATVIVGVVFTAVGARSLVDFSFASIAFTQAFLMPPLLLGSGAALTAYSLSMLRILRYAGKPASIWTRWAQVAVAALVVVSLFWATTLFAGALGRGHSMQLARNITGMPSVTVFSKNSMALAGAVERIVVPLDDAHAEYHYKYTGLHLLTRSGGKYFLLPEAWEPGTGPTIVLHEAPGYRIEIGPSTIAGGL